jgi:hypothetical protein
MNSIRTAAKATAAVSAAAPKATDISKGMGFK